LWSVKACWPYFVGADTCHTRRDAGEMVLNWYVPAGVTKAVAVVVALHVVLGIINPQALAGLLDRYTMILRMLLRFLAQLPE